MDTTKLIAKKRKGDVAVVAEMIGETEAYVKMLFIRTRAKKHQKAIDALAKIIEARETVMQNFTNTNQ